MLRLKVFVHWQLCHTSPPNTISAAYIDTKKCFLSPTPLPFPVCSERRHGSGLTCSTLGLRAAEQEEEAERSCWSHGTGLPLNSLRTATRRWSPCCRHTGTYRPAHRRLPEDGRQLGRDRYPAALAGESGGGGSRFSTYLREEWSGRAAPASRTSGYRRLVSSGTRRLSRREKASGQPAADRSTARTLEDGRRTPL